MNIPYDKNQKYQIGDIVTVVRADNSFRFPKIRDEEERGYGLNLMIVGSYWQCCGNRGIFVLNEDGSQSEYKNLSKYSVVVPKSLNTKCYNKNGEYEYNGFWCSKRDNFGWAWVNEKCLEFIRKPTKEEYNIAINEYKELTFD